MIFDILREKGDFAVRKVGGEIGRKLGKCGFLEDKGIMGRIIFVFVFIFNKEKV